MALESSWLAVRMMMMMIQAALGAGQSWGVPGRGGGGWGEACGVAGLRA